MRHASYAQRFPRRVLSVMPFLCECRSARCCLTINLPVAEYTAHTDGGLRLRIEGCQTPCHDQAVERCGTHAWMRSANDPDPDLARRTWPA